MMRRGSIYWAAAESQWYGEPKRLERLGYLHSEKRPGRKADRTPQLTPRPRRTGPPGVVRALRGLAALQEWLGRPSSLPRFQNEAIVRVLAGDIAGDDRELSDSLDAMRGE